MSSTDDIKAVFQTGLLIGFSVFTVTAYLIVSIVTLGLFSKKMGRVVFRVWANVCLWALGVKFTVTGLEHLKDSKSRIVVFNHSSILDNWICLSIFPTTGVPVVKREIIFYPIIGWALFFMDAVILNRKNRKSSSKTLKKLSQRMKKEDVSVFIAPEGTRTRTGELGPFKTGAFRIAMETKAPIVPFILHGARDLLPMGRYFATPGTVEVEILKPIPTDDITEENLREKAESIRQLFVEKLDR